MFKIKLTAEFKQALHLLEKTKHHVFVTGKAGTGKSTLLEYFRAHTKKEIAVLAPTGVAALNVAGQTIHSFFRFRPNITLDSVKKPFGWRLKLFKKLKTLVIDEVSMVRADLLDCIDKVLRLSKNPNLAFGGVQMIFIGDLYQLPPVVTGKERKIFKDLYESPYFFSAFVFEELDLKLIELTKIFRQKESRFIEVLNAVRNRSIDEAHLEILNKRLDPNFEPDLTDFYITLTSTNKLAHQINQQSLKKLKSKLWVFAGHITGKFEEKYYPTKLELELKEKAQVMFLNNDGDGRWVNGTVGRVLQFIENNDEDDLIVVELMDGSVVQAAPYTWKIFEYKYDELEKKIVAETVGSFTQYPLRLAWAVTIHKSQGKTFDKVVIDLGAGAFAHGQTYVALSRCTSLSGLVLKKPVEKKHILLDWKVVKFLTSFQYELAEKEMSMDQKTELINKAIENSTCFKMIYLKANDEKSERKIRPENIGKMEYMGKKFLGVSGFDYLRQEERVFRVDRILRMWEK